MPRFAYKARDQAGNAVESSVDAPTRKDALRLLSARGLSVDAVADAVPAPGSAPAAPQRGAARAQDSAADPAAGGRGRPDTAPRRAETLPFLESLHDLTSSGLSGRRGRAAPLDADQGAAASRRSARACGRRLSEGAPLSRAMEAYPEVFDSSTVNLIRAGEATGSLNDTLARLIDLLTEQREMRPALLTAMAYPIVIVIASFGVVLFFLFFLLPRLQTLLHSLGGKMPLSTRILIASANFTLHYGLFVAVAAVIGLVAAWRWRATDAGREKSDAWLLRMPAHRALHHLPDRPRLQPDARGPPAERDHGGRGAAHDRAPDQEPRAPEGLRRRDRPGARGRVALVGARRARAASRTWCWTASPSARTRETSSRACRTSRPPTSRRSRGSSTCSRR